MSWLTAALRWVWDFVVGDDWITAVGVVAALGLTALIAHTGTFAWWVMPPAVVALLALSLCRARCHPFLWPPGAARSRSFQGRDP
jgi:hypothetical protein